MRQLRQARCSLRFRGSRSRGRIGPGGDSSQRLDRPFNSDTYAASDSCSCRSIITRPRAYHTRLAFTTDELNTAEHLEPSRSINGAAAHAPVHQRYGQDTP